MQKTIIMTGMVIGSYVGGLIPLLWGESMLSMTSILLSGVGGIAGIYFSYRLTR